MRIKLYPMLKKGLASAAMLLFAGTAFAQPCTPVAGGLGACTNGSGTFMRINTVQTTGGIINIGNSNNACTGYTYYSGGGNTVRQNAGGTFNMSVAMQTSGTAFPYKVAVWIDWNHNDTFNNTDYNATTNPAGERMWVTPTSFTAYSVTSPSTGCPTITVPTTAKNGIARMRIRAGTRAGTSPYIPPSSPDPCIANDFYYGEVEDYDVDVVNPCLPPTTIFYSNITDKTANAHFTRRGNAIMYEYLITTTKGIPGTGNNYTTDSVIRMPNSLNPIACNTKYYFYVRSICDTGKGGEPTYLWEVSPWKEDSFTTAQCCYAPSAAVNYITSTTAIASWTPVPSVVKYEYVISADTSILAPTTPGVLTTATSVKLTGLAPKKDYKFFVRALCTPTPYSDWTVVTFLTQPTTGIGYTNTNSNFELQAFPNPVKDIVTLHVTKGMRVGTPHITVTDLNGRVVLQQTVSDYMIDVNLSDKPAGLYIIKYQDDENSRVLKVTKQ